MEQTQVAELQRLFGSLARSVLTLFMCITGGMGWDEVFDALRHISVAYAFLLVFFIAVVTLAALNIIAGIFINDAIEMAQMDRDIVIQTEMEKNKAMIKELSMLFFEFDIDKRGTITIDELTEAWTDPQVSARFRMLGVEEMDAAALFQTLDVDNSEEVDIKDFVMGCLRAKTLTRPVDFQTFVRESRRSAQAEQKQFNRVVSKLNKLRDEVRTLTSAKSAGSSSSLTVPEDEVSDDASLRRRLNLPDDGAGRPVIPRRRGRRIAAISRFFTDRAEARLAR